MVRLPDGRVAPSAKMYPLEWWAEVLKALPEHQFFQIGMQGDPVINGAMVYFNMDEAGIRALAAKCEYIVCCDSFLQHMLAPTYRKIIVLWSKSNPDIFGYSHNTNLLKDKELLRPDQYGIWPQCPYDPNAFIDYRILVDLIR